MLLKSLRDGSRLPTFCAHGAAPRCTALRHTPTRLFFKKMLKLPPSRIELRMEDLQEFDALRAQARSDGGVPVRAAHVPIVRTAAERIGLAAPAGAFPQQRGMGPSLGVGAPEPAERRWQ